MIDMFFGQFIKITKNVLMLSENDHIDDHMIDFCTIKLYLRGCMILGRILILYLNVTFCNI